MHCPGSCNVIAFSYFAHRPLWLKNDMEFDWNAVNEPEGRSIYNLVTEANGCPQYIQNKIRDLVKTKYIVPNERRGPTTANRRSRNPATMTPGTVKFDRYQAWVANRIPPP